MKNRLLAFGLVIASVALASITLLPKKLVVQGTSMLPSYRSGDTVYVSSLAYGLPLPFSNRLAVRWKSPSPPGEIVVFLEPMEGTMTMKRCIGAGGDVITIRNAFLHIGSTRVAVSPSQASYYSRHGIIPDGSMFVVGDNPISSLDSRHFGFVEVHSVVGRIVGVAHE